MTPTEVALRNARQAAAAQAQHEPIVTSMPTGVSLHITNVCNIDPPCVQCWKYVDPVHGWLNKDALDFPLELVDRLAEPLRATAALHLVGVGEPFASKTLLAPLAYTSPACFVYATTNGLLLRGARADLACEKFKMINVSIDAATAETYAKIRGRDFGLLCENIQAIAQRSPRPRIAINMSVMQANVHEVPVFVDLAATLGADEVSVFPINYGNVDYKTAGWFDYQTQMKMDVDALRKAHDAFNARAAILGITAHSTLVGGPPPSLTSTSCPLPWSQIMVTQQGHVYFCCWQSMPIGNLLTNTFAEIWNGEVAQRVRCAVAANQVDSTCNNVANTCVYVRQLRRGLNVIP